MTTLKQRDLIKDSDGDTRKILGVCGDVVHISHTGNDNHFSFTSTELDLKNDCYTWDTPAWEPEIGQSYWTILGQGCVFTYWWNNTEADRARRDFLGIYQTKELCEAALLEIRRKLGK